MASSLGAVSTWHLMPMNCLGIMPILQLKGLRLGAGAELPRIPGNLPTELEKAKHDNNEDDPQAKIPTPLPTPLRVAPVQPKHLKTVQAKNPAGVPGHRRVR